MPDLSPRLGGLAAIFALVQDDAFDQGGSKRVAALWAMQNGVVA